MPAGVRVSMCEKSNSDVCTLDDDTVGVDTLFVSVVDDRLSECLCIGVKVWAQEFQGRMGCIQTYSVSMAACAGPWGILTALLNVV
jgi:hypothetical protein